MNYRVLRFRIGLIFTVIACILGLYVTRLYKLQMVQSSEESYQGAGTFTYQTTITAARGTIYDSTGRVLVSNRASYDLSLIYAVLFNADDPNGALQTLAENCKNLGVTITDHLPVTRERPYTYDFDSVSSAYEDYYTQWLPKRKLDPDESAEQLIRTLRSKYHLPEDLDDETARTLVGMRYELDLRRWFNNLENYVVVYDVPSEVLASLLELSTPGLTVQTSTARVYHTEYCAHLLGHVGLMDAEQYEHYKELDYPMNAVVGQDGLELAFEEYLHGKDGRMLTTVVTATGEIVGQEIIKEPEPGQNVQLTIDLELQTVAEDALESLILDLRENGVGTHKEGKDAGGGAVVVQEVGTGRVLASGSYPTFNLGTLAQDFAKLNADETAPMYNRALSAAYPPGSVFKMVTTAAMVDIAGMNRWYQIEDEGVYLFYEDTPLRCFYYKNTGTTHGVINVMEALSVSCNYYFYEVGRLMGIDAIDQMAKGFGFGEPTGVELWENTGARANPETKASLYDDELQSGWWGADTLTAAIGQSETKATPLQLCSYASTLANGGIRYRATFLDRVRTADDSETVFVNTPEIAEDLHLSEDAVAAIHEGMELTATEGTAAQYLWDYPIPVACKTGTAQHGGLGSDNASFVLYAPADNPEIAISVYVERGAQGGNLANVARTVLDYYFARQEGVLTDPGENVIG